MGLGRGLKDFEVALIKAMVAAKFKRDHVMSYFVRPGRIISPAAISEINSGKIGESIAAASPTELAAYMELRLNEPPPEADLLQDQPFSPTRLRARLLEWLQPQRTFEGGDLEVKSRIPDTKEGVAKIVKAISAFANSSGGYIYFGVDDNGEIIGINNDQGEQEFLRSIGDKCREILCPAVDWKRIIFELNGKFVACIYVAPAILRPVICMSDYTNAIASGGIYNRYSGQSSAIRPGDLLNMLRERDLSLMQQARSGPS